MTKLYKIHLLKGEYFGERERKYCLESNIMALGWSISDHPEVNDYQGYRKVAESKYGNSQGFRAAINAIDSMERGDLCWAKVDGVYYLGKIDDDGPDYKYHKDKDLGNIGAFRQCVWKEYNIDQVPGDIIRGLIGGFTLNRVHSEVSFFYSKFLYDGTKIQTDRGFADLLSPDDQEDLLGIYLQVKNDYILFPSTSKIDTAGFEYMLVHKNTHKRAVVQCKTGGASIPDDSSLLTDKFADFDVYLTTVYGDYPSQHGPNVHIIKIDALEAFARAHKGVLPRRIQNFLEFLDN